MRCNGGTDESERDGYRLGLWSGLRSPFYGFNSLVGLNSSGTTIDKRYVAKTDDVNQAKAAHVAPGSTAATRYGVKTSSVAPVKAAMTCSSSTRAVPNSLPRA